jgi:hypothetical protein
MLNAEKPTKLQTRQAISFAATSSRNVTCVEHVHTSARDIATMPISLGADGLDIVAVGVEHICRVIPGSVVFAYTGRAVITAACSEPLLVEAVDYISIGRAQRDVGTGSSAVIARIEP